MNNILSWPVAGDAMTPTFAHGDRLLIDTRIDHIAADGIYLLQPTGGGEPQLRRAQREPGGSQIRLVADNTAYPILHCYDADIQVIGRAIAFFRTISGKFR